MKNLRAVIFDFDGLILDTEATGLKSWEDVYEEYGIEFPFDQWLKTIGGKAATDFDPYTYLDERTAEVIDRAAIKNRRDTYELKQLETQPVLPGVLERIREAKELGLKLGIASSSDANWVFTHLNRLGLIDEFEVIKTRDDVKHTKPDPELFNTVLAELAVSAEEAIVLEDSENGILAAKRAGIFCVVVPNSITSRLDLSQADLLLESLEQLSLRELVDRL